MEACASLRGLIPCLPSELKYGPLVLIGYIMVIQWFQIRGLCYGP